MLESKTPSFEEMGYRLDHDRGVWVTKNNSEFAYSDGDEQEKYIFNAVRNSRDVSCSSDELPIKIKDWPSEYHLSPVRSNLMAPFQIKQGSSILELGCGMGAITRYHGEIGAKVTAVEGSLQRAAIARERCRDLNNVQVVCDNFKDFQTDEKFDIVTLIGVMEYSPKYIGGNDPFSECLEIAKSFLKPEGVVIIAIENRLGLKYWNNCAEDHTNGIFDSIHDTYPPNTVSTFGYGELKDMLAKAGFVYVEFLFPFPDYKLPSVIFHEKSLKQKEIRFASIIGQQSSRDYSGQFNRNFSEQLAWQTIEKNRLIPHFSNSFLCVCALSPDARPLVSEDWVVKIYNSSRSACFRTETTIYRDKATNTIQVSKKRKYPNLPMNQGPLVFNRDIEKNYIQGIVMSEEILKAVLRHDTLDAFYQKMKEYKDVVILISKKLNRSITPEYCPGELIDCTPYNLIRAEDRSLHYIDNEWTTKDDLPLHFILLRGIVTEITHKINFIDNPFLFSQFTTLKDLVASIFKAMNLQLSQEDIELFCSYESAIQAQVAGMPHKQDAMAEEFKAIFSAPLNDVLGIIDRLSAYDICKMQFDKFLEDNREKTTITKVDSIIFERLEKLETHSRNTGNILDMSKPLGNNYDILIPIYNAFEHLQRCIDSVLLHTRGNHEIYLLDDCSKDHRVLPLLKSYEDANERVHVIESAENRGFVQNVNRGFELSQNDVVILNSDTEVTEGWLDRMDRCLHSRPDIGIVCPLSNNATILSVPVMNQPNSLPEGMDVKRFGSLIDEVSPRDYPELPTGVGFCMLISRDTLNLTGFFDPEFGMGYGEENDLCQRARAAGKKIVCCDDAYVYHYGEASFNGIDRISEKRMENERLLQSKWPHYIKDVYEFCCRNPLRELQERIFTLTKEHEMPVLPSILHVIHSFDMLGGTELHTRNIIDGLSPRFHSTVIYPASVPDQWIDLTAKDVNGYLRILKLRKELIMVSDSFIGAPGDLINEDVEDIFASFIRGGNYSVVHFQHLIGWDSLLLPIIAKHQGCKVVISLHDYYLLCPEYNLILPDLRRCGKTLADSQDTECLYCLGAKRRYHQTDKPPNLHDYIAKRKQIITRVFEAADTLIAPSDFVREQFIRAYGGIIKDKIITVPHGIEPLKKCKRKNKGNILRVGFLGNASDRKGILILLQTARSLKGMPIKFEIFGGLPPAVKKMATELGIVQHGSYDRKDLPLLLSRTNLIIIPSVWDETFCLTVSESQMMGIPVLAANAGAISERIIDGETGFLVPTNNVKAIAEKLLVIQKNPRLLESVASNLQNYRLKTIQENVEDYARIYDQLINNALCSADDKKSVQLQSRGNAISSIDSTNNVLTSIIILCFNQLEYTKKCLQSIVKYTSVPYELILVDNGSSDGTAPFLEDWANKHSNCKIIFNNENRGFAAGNNQGIAAAKGDYILLLNNDVIVTRDWLKRLLAHIDSDENIGMAGPVSNSVSGPQQVEHVTYGQNMNKMQNFARNYSKNNVGRTQEIFRLVGFCLLIKRQVLDIIGGLDENYGNGNYEDDDLCLRSGIAGFRNIIAHDVFIHHYGSMTFKGNNIDYKDSLEDNHRRFADKWTDIIEVNGNEYRVCMTKEDQLKKLLEWGEERFSQGNFNAAVKIFERVLKLDKVNSQAMNNLGVIQWQIGKEPAPAMKTFQAALVLNPKDSDALENLVQAAMESSRFDLINPALLNTLKKAQPANPDIVTLINAQQNSAMIA
jgi:GT2 family glycosyltransferase/glycosyltransferase involved in cell wall biosynthesis/SAM-dependent methyltransferase